MEIEINKLKGTATIIISICNKTALSSRKNGQQTKLKKVAFKNRDK